MWQPVRSAISWILTGPTELHSNSGTPNDTRTLKQRLFHIPDSMDEISFTSFLQPYLYVGVLYLERRPTYFELSSSRNTHWERVPRKRVVWHVHTMNLLSIFHIPKLKWEKWEQGIHIQLSEKITIASFARRIQISSTKGHKMFQATLDSVVCRAQFFCLQIVKNQNKKQAKTTKNNNHKSREIHKSWQSSFQNIPLSIP